MNFNKELQSIIDYYGVTQSDKLKADIKDLFLNSIVDLFHIAKKQHKANSKYSKSQVKNITSAVETVFDLSEGDVLKKTYTFNPILPRQFAQYFMMKDGMPVTYIAKQFSQDHTSIYHSKKVIENYLWQGSYQAEYDEINRLIIEGLFIDNGEAAPSDCEL